MRVSKTKGPAAAAVGMVEKTVFIARIQKSIDHDPHQETICTTLGEAVKTLPREARKLNWSMVLANKFDRYTLNNGTIVSIEKTTE